MLADSDGPWDSGDDGYRLKDVSFGRDLAELLGRILAIAVFLHEELSFPWPGIDPMYVLWAIHGRDNSHWVPSVDAIEFLAPQLHPGWACIEDIISGRANVPADTNVAHSFKAPFRALEDLLGIFAIIPSDRQHCRQAIIRRDVSYLSHYLFLHAEPGAGGGHA
jgi:hypothetical protein